MPSSHAHKFKLANLLKPLGASVLINACLMALMVRVFTAAPDQPKRYMSVELRIPVQSVHPQFKQAVVQRAVLPPPKSQPQSRPQHIVKAKPFSKVLPYKQEIGSRSVQNITPGNTGGSYAQPSAGVETGASVGPIYAGPGPGANVGGATGDGSGHNPTHATTASAPAVHVPQPAPSTVKKPEPPKPAPPGESRSPQVAKQVKPAYPTDARDDGVEGVVSLSVTVGPNGRVASARIEQSSGDRRLDKAALDAVRNWTYTPCIKNGEAVEATVRVHVDFRLD